MILVFDNYDSFTFNLVHCLAELGAEVAVVRSDMMPARDALASGAEAFLISPGPGTPAQAGHSLALARACVAERRPLLGVCLGHQCLAQAFGAVIERAPSAMHGKTSAILHDGTGLFADLPTPLTMARYHSLVAREAGMNAELAINARAEDGTLQGLRHRALPVHGVQFHPESIASEHGAALLRNFLRVAAIWSSGKRS
jgi:anthranilate synthase component 2